MAQLEIEHLTKRFGSITAVHDLTLEVADGEFLVLLGPNGAGKTTTLRCVAGLEKPDAGHIKMEDQLVDGMSPAARNVAFVFQNYALYPRKTVFQNIAFPLEAHRYPREEIRQRVHQVADLLHITHLLDRRPAQLSGGEQQRVALGRALVRQARIYLMDEPLTNLDFKLRVEMRTEFKRLHEEFRYTLLYVTNDQTEAMALADRIAVLHRGHLQQVGSPGEVYDHPVNLFVATFIGFPRMNLLDCALSTDGPARLCAQDGAWAIPAPDRVREAVRRVGRERVILGIRPEDLTPAFEEQPASLAGRVFVIEPLGDRTIVDVQVGGVTVRVKAHAEIRVDVGQPIWLVPNLNRLHVFDPQTGRAL